MKPAQKKARRLQTTLIRAVVWDRSQGRCEGCCKFLADEVGEMDHMWGRAKVAQQVSNCWRLCTPCHRAKTDNRPSRANWLHRILFVVNQHDYTDEKERCLARLAVLTAKGMAP